LPRARRTVDTGGSDTGGTQRHGVAAALGVWNRHENFDEADAMKAATWRLTGAATALTALIAGSRASFGIFLSPLNTATGLGMASIALAVAFGQLAAGIALPMVEALARRFGPARVIAGGACLLAPEHGAPDLRPHP
jgi:hypothetical protein